LRASATVQKTLCFWPLVSTWFPWF